MNMSGDNIILNSCQYTPVYFIENPGVSQAGSYVVAPNNQCVDKPVSESLKRFYESSGNLESNLTVADNTTKAKITRKSDTNVVGNNLKLASFLLPKCETKTEISKPIITPANSVVLKPLYIAPNNVSVNNVNSPNQVPKIDVNSRLVKLKDLPNIVRSQNGKIWPKIKPKQNSLSSKPKHTAVQAVQPVQLVKFGQTYHSLNKLSTEQMKVVNHALKMLNTQSNPPDTAYDPTTNTKFIYKVISQKDYTEQNKMAKKISAEIKKEPIKFEEPDIIEEEEKEERKIIIEIIVQTRDEKDSNSISVRIPDVQKLQQFPKINFKTTFCESKVTRSGRVVKLPKNIILDDSPSKPKKHLSAIFACLQCNSKFSSPQRLHRHYENHPTHTPSNFHSNLFHCLVAMVSAGTEAEQANILLQQLKLLVERLRDCMPCLLKGNKMETMSEITDDVSKLFGISPGKYNLNMKALSCEKDKDGYCSHNPRPQITVAENIKPHVILENGVSKGPSNILKVNLQDRRPKILRKLECRKQKLEQRSPNDNGKKIKFSQDIISRDKNSNSIELNEFVALLSDTAKTDNEESKVIDKLILNVQKEFKQDTDPAKAEKVKKPPHIQFHSAHFDIRSSPIKPTSTVFRKFQINPEKMTKYVEIIQPIQLNQLAQDVEMTNIDNDKTAPEIFSGTNVITSKETENLNYATNKIWCEDPSSFMKQNDLINTHTDNFMKSNAVIEPSLLHFKNGVRATNKAANESLNHINNESKVANKVTKHNSVLDSNIFNKDMHVNHYYQVNKVDEQTDFTKPSILIEPLTLTRNDHDIETEKLSNDSDDFMKSDILMDQTLLNTQDCKVIDEIANSNHDFMKSNILIEPALIHSQDAQIDKFADQADSFMSSNVYNPTLPQSNVNNENPAIVTESNEIDVDLNSSQGQSIISFLESLGNELAYTDTETDSRNNVDFQLDLFSFNNS